MNSSGFQPEKHSVKSIPDVQENIQNYYISFIFETSNSELVHFLYKTEVSECSLDIVNSVHVAAVLQ